MENEELATKLINDYTPVDGNLYDFYDVYHMLIDMAVYKDINIVKMKCCHNCDHMLTTMRAWCDYSDCSHSFDYVCEHWKLWEKHDD